MSIHPEEKGLLIRSETSRDNEDYPELIASNSSNDKDFDYSPWNGWKILSWTLQILIWFYLIKLLFGMMQNKVVEGDPSLIIFIYISYVINAYLNSSTYKFLTHLVRAQTIFLYIEKISYS